MIQRVQTCKPKKPPKTKQTKTKAKKKIIYQKPPKPSLVPVLPL